MNRTFTISKNSNKPMPEGPDNPGFTPYSERPIKFAGFREVRGSVLKAYVTLYGTGFDMPRFQPGLEAALREVPAPEPSAGRPGLGFVILHQGRTGDYVVVCWWDHENELPTRVFVRDDKRWRPADTESFCVWDLEIMWFERSAYIETVLRPSAPSKQEYLERHFSV